VQSQVRLNRVPKKVPKKVPEKVPGGFGAESGQVQQGSKEGSGEGLGGFGAAGQIQQGSREGSGEGSGRLWSTLRCFQRFASQHTSERFVKIKRCGCWGYHRSLLCLLKWGFAQAPDSSAIFLIKSLRIIVFFKYLRKRLIAVRYLKGWFAIDLSPPQCVASTAPALRLKMCIATQRCHTWWMGNITIISYHIRTTNAYV